MLNVNKIRSDFHIFSEQEDLVYLDSAATSLTPDSVVDEMVDYYKNYRGTVHRSMYKNGMKADEKYNYSRQVTADFLNANLDEIVFCKSTTAGMNSLARAITAKLPKGSEILVSEIEHHSTLLPWREYGKQNDCTVNYIELDNSQITLAKVEEACNENTKVIAINHVSNVLGDVVDIKSIGEFCQANDIILVVDGAQAITHEKVDVKDLNCDFYVFSAHKMLGPTGLGVIYGKKEQLKDLIFDYGGDMAHVVTEDSVSFKDKPLGLEAGTPSIAEIICFAKAIEYLNEIGMEAIHAHVTELKEYMVQELSKIEHVHIYNPNSQSGIVTFNINSIPSHDVLQVYSDHNVAIRGGHMCNQLTLKHLGVYSVLRASMYIYNDKADVDKFIEVTKEAIKELEWML